MRLSWSEPAEHTTRFKAHPMPELPDLAVVGEQLAARISGRRISGAETPTPILVRATPQELAALIGMTVGPARRRGKFPLCERCWPLKTQPR